MSYIIEGLYMGDCDDPYNTQHLREKLGVTHILTIECKPLTLEAREGFCYKYVNALDTDTTDLLTHIEDCNEFIDEGRQASGVLVHCRSGMSRSGTIVVAYVMHKLDMSLEAALKLVRCQRPQTRPNPGFMEQLELYDHMGRGVDPTSNSYKSYRLAKLATEIQKAHGYVTLPEGSLVSDPTNISASDTVHKCKKCRRNLFKACSVIGHNEGCGQEAFSQPWLAHHRTDRVTCTQSLFTEPITWMTSQIVELQGKLMCPKCSAKLGSYNWCGERCPCGQWVCPAFHISNSKVDECRPRLPPSSVKPAGTVAASNTASQSGS